MKGNVNKINDNNESRKNVTNIFNLKTLTINIARRKIEKKGRGSIWKKKVRFGFMPTIGSSLLNHIV